MNQAPDFAAANLSRLVSFLRQLQVADAAISHRNFADKLGQLIDLADSFTLADELRALPRLRFEPQQLDRQQLKVAFLEERMALTETIVKRFVPDSASLSINLPMPDSSAETSASKAFEPYYRFYALQQSEMESRIHRLRQRVRQTLTGTSQTMAQLAKLDSTLHQALSTQIRKSFAVVPRLLARHFEQLRQQPHPIAADEQASAWLAQFYRDMQSLLLAELDIRLQPVIGLIEALDDEMEQQ